MGRGLGVPDHHHHASNHHLFSDSPTYLTLGAGLSPAEGSGKPIAGFTSNKISLFTVGLVALSVNSNGFSGLFSMSRWHL
jgi:hypothetical protein